MPLLHPNRHGHPISGHAEYEDDLQFIYQAGIRAIVSLVDYPSLPEIYRAAGFDVRSMPVRDGTAPSLEQFASFVAFVDEQRALDRPVAVHCLAGRGRTGTVIAGYLIARCATAEAALAHVRRLVPQAIETRVQLQFLSEVANRGIR